MLEEKNEKNNEEALVLVALRNEFYRKKYHTTFGIVMLCVLIIIILFFSLLYLVEHPTRPLYFITDPVSRLIRQIPNSEPNMSTENAMAWAIEAVEEANSYDFVNYRAQLQNAQKYFTEYGWQNYMQGLTESNNLAGLTKRQLVFVAKVTGPPKLLVQGLLGGAYAWKFQMPLLVRYLQPPTYDIQTSFANAYIVTVIVQRQDLLQSYKGLAILQMITAAPAQSNQPGAIPATAPT